MKKVIIFIIFLYLPIYASHLSSPITNTADPFGPLPDNSSFIFHINRTTYHDYVNILKKDNTIRRRLVVDNTANGSGDIRITDTWNGQDDSGANCESGTYNANIKVSRHAKFDVKIPGAINNIAEFQNPKDIACDKYGYVYVLDTTLLTVQKFSSDGALIWKHTFPQGTANGQLNFPSADVGGLTVDTNMYFYISDQGANRGRIQKFDQDGNLIDRFGGNADVNNGDDNFTGLGYSKEYGEVYTVALNSDDAMRVLVNGTGNMSLGNQNTRLGNVNMQDFAIESDGDVYTIYGTRIRRWTRARFTGNNNPNNNWNTALANSYSICIRSNSLYTIGGSDQIRQHNLANGVAQETRGSFGYANTNFWDPRGITYDPVNDLIWVADTGNRRLVAYKENASGALEYVKKIESSPYLMGSPQDMALDKNGNIYIVDNDACVVKKFDEFGNYLMSFGGRGYGNGKLWDPRGVAVDNSGYVYISDLGTANGNDAEDQIEKYDPSGNFVNAWDHADGRGMMSFVRNGSNFIVAIGQVAGAGRDCGMRVYWTNGTIVQSFRNSYNDTDYGEIDRDFLGRFYCINISGTSYVDTYPSTSSGNTAPNPYVNIGGTRAGLTIDDYGALWIPDQQNDDVEVRQTYAVGTPSTVMYAFSGAGTGDGLLTDPTYCAIRIRNLPNHWADFWVVDTGNDRLEKFVISWSNEIIEPVTIANPGAPVVTTAHPDTESTNTTLANSVYYTRQGKTIFEIYFSQNMNTAILPIVKFITADNLSYTITQTNYMNNLWIGTSWVPTGHDGSAKIKIENAQNTAGSNLNPNPTIIQDAFIIDTTPPTITISHPSYGMATTATQIIVDGNTESEIRVDIFNWTASSGGTLISSHSNIISGGTGYFMYNNLSLLQPKDSTNYITVKACDKAGNWSAEYSPRILVRCINAIGYAFVDPSTNRRLGDLGNPYITFTWQANASMNNGTVVVDVPPGWSLPSTNQSAPGYVRIIDSTGIVLTSGKELWTGNPSYPRRFKVNFDSADSGGYFKIAYGTNTQTMVSNSFSVAIGNNNWDVKATNGTTLFTNIWDPPKKVGESSGKQLYIPVIGNPLLVVASNKMVTQTYRGASSVQAMRIFFINSNDFHTDEVDSLTLTTLDSFGNEIQANTRLNSISSWTSSLLYKSSSAGSSSFITLDLSLNPWIIQPHETNYIDIKMDIDSSTSETDIQLELKSVNDISAKNYANIAGTSIHVIGNLPYQTSYALISSNQPVKTMFISSTNLNLQFVDVGQLNAVPLQIIFPNTNSNVNDVDITEVHITVQNKDGVSFVPSDIFSWAKLQKNNNGTIYAQKSPETSGNQIVFEPSTLYISPNSSVTCDIKVDIKSNTTITNFYLSLMSKTKILARDKNLYTPVTNYATSGYSFPMNSLNIDVVKYLFIEHDTSAQQGVWEPITFSALNFANHIIPSYTNSVIVDCTNSTATNVNWTNNLSSSGWFSNAGPSSGEAYYTFATSDTGTIQLAISDTTSETLSVRIQDDWLTAISNNLVVSSANFQLQIIKTAYITNAPSYVSLGGNVHDVVPGAMIIYTVTFSNTTSAKGTNVVLQDTLKSNLKYVSNSIYLKGILQTDALDGDKTDYGQTLSNTITSTLKSVLANEKNTLIYKVIVK